MEKFKSLFSRVLIFVFGRFRAKPTSLQSQPTAQPCTASPISPAVVRGPNRAERRQFERARRRHDKFVQPKGPTPISKPRGPAPARVRAAPVVEITDPGDLIVDDHHSNGEKVLYETSELWGEFNFRDTILDQLDRYAVYLERMKRREPDTYEFYKRVGAVTLPYSSTGCGYRARYKKEPVPENPPLSHWFNKYRPSFGCVAYGTNPLAEEKETADRDPDDKNLRRWIPKFMYICKYENPPPQMQPMAGGDVYKLTIWWDKPHGTKRECRHGGIPQDIGIFVSADGTKLQVLRTLETRKIPIKGKRGYFRIPQRQWRIPHGYEEWAEERGDDAQHYLTGLFIQTANLIETSNYSMVRVAATKNDLTAVFSVNVKRIPYFFQDRDIELTEDGVKKRIFHIVRPHERKTKFGTKAIKFHFRGLREFSWADYRVSITVPGRDHFNLAEYNVGATDEYWVDKKKEYLTEAEIGQRLVERMKMGLGRYHGVVQ